MAFIVVVFLAKMLSTAADVLKGLLLISFMTLQFGK
jgi:hypothetical protein